jgi:hypothetical protein
MTSVVFSGAYDGCVSLDDNARGVRDAKERIQKGELVKTMPLRMANGVSRAEFWKSFILDRCDFPKPELLATQFEHYDLIDFCDCSCNNFTVRVRPGSNVQILVKTSSYALVFQADFYLRCTLGKDLKLVLSMLEKPVLCYATKHKSSSNNRTILSV